MIKLKLMMQLIVSASVLIFSFWLVVKSSIILVKSLINLARFFKISEYSLAFIIMGFTTSLPELSIAIQSAIQKINEISLGNIIGANITDILLIIGLTVLIKNGLKLEKETFSDGWLILALISFIFILGIDGSISK